MTVVSDSTLYVLAMNSCSKAIVVEIAVDNADKSSKQNWKKDFGKITIEPYGLKVLEIEINR